jgi:hypothetical protein
MDLGPRRRETMRSQWVVLEGSRCEMMRRGVVIVKAGSSDVEVVVVNILLRSWFFLRGKTMNTRQYGLYYVVVSEVPGEMSHFDSCVSMYEVR